MYSAYKLNKQGDNIQPWHTPFPIWNQSVVPCPVLTVASWPAYRFLKRRRSGGLERQRSTELLFNSLWPCGLQHTRLPCVCCIATSQSLLKLMSIESVADISSSVTPFFFCPQSFSASGSFPMSQLFASGGQSVAVSASTSVLPMSIQHWFSFGLTGFISLQSKGLSRVFSSTTIWKHQFFGTQRE